MQKGRKVPPKTTFDEPRFEDLLTEEESRRANILPREDRGLPSLQTKRQPCLYPLPNGFLVEFQQWLWYRLKNDARARLLATTPLTDPRSFPRYMDGKRWDHPDFVYATLAPGLFQYFCDAYRFQSRPGDAWEAMVEKGYSEYVEYEGLALSVSDIAMAEDGWKYDWFADSANPWDKDWHLVREFGEPAPAVASKSRRFEILRRDNFRCQLCGRSAQDGVSLEVDHIKPRAKGGVAVPWNLWTLCADCNGAKLHRY